MKGKFLILIAFVFIVSMAAVSATDDLNQTLAISQEDNEIFESADNGTFAELQQKIDAASEGSTINLENDYFANGFGTITVNKALTINGNGYTIDASGSSNILEIGSAAVTLNNITFKHGSSEGYGGAICCDGKISLSGCSFMDCYSHEHGGAIYSVGDVSLVDCRFENCKNGEANGGAVYSRGNVNAIGTTFLNCFSVYYGGAIYCKNNVDVLNCSFIGNYQEFTDYEGGGAIHSSGNLTVHDSNFTDNHAFSGGAIYSSGNFYISGCNFMGNGAEGNGGVLYVKSPGSIANCSFAGNSIRDFHATDNGGAIYSDADITILDSSFTGFYAYKNGGAIYSTSNLNVIDCDFLDCQARNYGGAVYSRANADFDSCSFIASRASYDGGAIYAEENGNTTISNTFFDKNSPNDFYPGNVNTSNITISSHMNLDFNKSVIYQFDGVDIKITFDEGVTGIVWVSINGVEEKYELTGNSLSIIKPNLSAGEYVVTVRYSGDDVFSPTDETESFKVVAASFKDLQEIIDNSDKNEIDLTGNYTYVDYVDGSAPISIKRNIKINGNGYVLDGSRAMGIFNISSPNVILKDINFVDGLNMMGGAIYSTVSFDVVNCSFYNCSAWRGGAIYSESAFNIVDSSFDRCSLNRPLGNWIYGSIIWVSDDDGILTIANSTFTNPYTFGSSSTFQIFRLGCEAYLDGCVFLNCSDELYTSRNIDFVNSAFINSTGIEAYAHVNVSNSIFEDSEIISSSEIDVFDSTLKDSYILSEVNINLSDSDIISSTVKSKGNAVIFNSTFIDDASYEYGNYIECSANLTVNASAFVNCFDKYGESIIYSLGNVHILDSSFINSSGRSAGAIYSKANVTVENSTFINSSGWYGGVIYCEANACLSYSSFVNSSSYMEGGVIYSRGNVIADNCSFEHSSSGFYGGAIYSLKDSIISLNNCIFNHNYAKFGYGDIILNSNSTVCNCTFMNGNAERGGAIYFNNELSYGMNSFLSMNLTNLKLKNNLPFDYAGAISFSDDILCIGAQHDYDQFISGEVLLDIAGKAFKNTFDSEGKASFDLKGIPSGTLNARISYSGDDHFAPFEINVPLTIGQSAYCLDVPDVTKDYLGPERLEITLTKDNNPVSNANVNIRMNDFDYTRTTDGNGKAYMDLNLNAGIYAADVSYADVFTTSMVTVKQLSSETVLSYTKNSPNRVTLTAEVSPSSIAGDVVFTVNGSDYTAEITGGKATYVLSNLEVGSYDAKAAYMGETNYRPSSSDIIKFTVADAEYDVNAPDLTKYYHGPERFVVTVRDKANNPVAGKNVTIYLNGATYTRTTNENGEASMAINLNSGVYAVTSEFEGIEVQSTITVKSTISGENITKMFRNATQYYAAFVDTSGKTLAENTAVEFNINGVFYTRYTNGEGVARMNINLNPGEYIITAKNPDSGEQYTNIITVLPTIVENYDLTKYYKNASQYSLCLLDEKGNPVKAGVDVKLNINGVFYTRTSNDDGYVKMNINLEPGEYTITAEYNGLMASNKIKVLSVIETHDLVMKYKDGSKFEAKILDGQGNAYPGQKVTFNINGVFYERITGDDGIARLNINLMAGEYIITSSYNGMNAANKVTISS